ncbi:inorganic phosphate transporter [Candidatus Saganbacteria bacterium]|nr:inorganic phosphate transporter [Candidatus Saganbacteria bacterium]
MLVVLLVLIVIFFAVNMGGSGIAPSFAAVHGAKLISYLNSVLLFSGFVILGALALGGRVSKTLSSGLIDHKLFTFEVALIVLGSAAISLFIANMLKVPQSTSWVTVFPLFGAAIYFKDLNFVTAFHMVGMWLVLPITAFFLTYYFFGRIYPPRPSNFWFYEKTHIWKKRIHILALVSSCYVAFAIGANNVANAVGPLVGANLIQTFWGLILVAPLFGVGGLLIGDKTMHTLGKEIVPLGLVTSTIVSFVTATLLLVASFMGFPQSLVQLNTLAIFAIGTIKHEHVMSSGGKSGPKTLIVWLVAPIVSGIISFLLLSVFKV